MSNFTWVEIYKEIVEKIKDKNTEDLVNSYILLII